MNYKITTQNEQINTVQAHILRLIWDEGGISRTDIAARLSVAKATVTKFVNKLIAADILYEAGEELVEHPMKQGRRKVLVDFNREKRFILGVYVGDDGLSAGLTTLRGECLGKVNEPLSSDATAETVTVQIRTAVERLIKDSCITPDRILSAGISAEHGLMEKLGLSNCAAFEDSIRTVVNINVYSGNGTALRAFACVEEDGGVNQPYSCAVIEFVGKRVYMTEIGVGAVFERELYRMRDITPAADLIEMPSERSNRSVAAFAELITSVLVISNVSRVGLIGAKLSDEELADLKIRVQEFTGEDMTDRIKAYGLPENHRYRGAGCYAAVMTFCRSGELLSDEAD